MKCQHCGINFEDTEKECPVCGARAGSPGRMSTTKRSTFSGKTVRGSGKKSYSQKASFPAPDSRARGTYKNQQNKRTKAVVLVSALCMIAGFLPAIMGIAYRQLKSINTGPQPEISYSTAVRVYSLYDVLDGGISTELSDGTYISLYPYSDDEYELYIETPEGSYSETGKGQCSPIEYDDMYNPAFPPELYTTYELYLSASQIEYDNADGSDTIPEAYNSRMNSTEELYLILYVNTDYNFVTLYDINGSGLFGGETYTDFPA